MTKNEEKASRYLKYIAILRENEGKILCCDCGEELLMSDLIDNYDEPLCLDCIRSLKN